METIVVENLEGESNTQQDQAQQEPQVDNSEGLEELTGLAWTDEMKTQFQSSAHKPGTAEENEGGEVEAGDKGEGGVGGENEELQDASLPKLAEADDDAA